MKRNDKKLFSTLDLYLSAFLSLKNILPSFTNNNGRIIFEFEISNKLYNLIESYNSNTEVPAIDFVNEIKTLRSRMLTMRGERKCTS